MKFPKRNFISNNKNIDTKKTYSNIGNYQKPYGLWYSCNSAWYDWILLEHMREWLYKYIYKIYIYKNIQTDIRNKDNRKLLLINNLKDFDIFNNRYKYKTTKNIRAQINWNKVSEDYGGIEICPYFTTRRKYLWYMSWDVASGCIWNTSIIKNIDLIYTRKDGKYIKVL
jgi:hypothetical protein